MTKKTSEIETTQPEPLATTPSFAVWRDLDEAGDLVYHLELGMFTAHFFEEDWQELLTLFDAIKAKSAPASKN